VIESAALDPKRTVSSFGYSEHGWRVLTPGDAIVKERHEDGKAAVGIEVAIINPEPGVMCGFR
jgi:hypothetical protein